MINTVCYPLYCSQKNLDGVCHDHLPTSPQTQNRSHNPDYIAPPHQENHLRNGSSVVLPSFVDYVLKKIEKSAITLLPHNKTGKKSYQSWGYIMYKCPARSHPYKGERREQCRPAVSHVYIVPKTSSLAVTYIQKRIGSPHVGPKLKGQCIAEWHFSKKKDRTREFRSL
jgi:hypothetical protein